MELWHGGSPHPKKFRVQKSAGKVLASIFWNQDEILLIDYLPAVQTLNAKYYSSLLVQLKDILKEKRREVTKGVLFLHDNAWLIGHLQLRRNWPTWTSSVLITHPDLAPSDYLLSLGLKKQLKRHHFSSDAEVIVAAETWLDGQISEFF